MKHKLQHIRALKEALARLPAVEVEPTELTMQEAVKLLRPEVASLLRKGYSFDMIATVLDKNGFAVAASTLKKYRNGGKQDAVRKGARSGPENSAGTARGKSRTPPAAGVEETRQAGGSVPGAPGVGGFTPLDDTQDI